MHEKHIRKDIYQIIWVKKGRGHFNCRKLTQEINENFVYLISPGQCYTLEPNTRFEGYLISFSEDFLSLSGIEILNIFHLETKKFHTIFPQIQADSEMESELEAIMFNMIKEYANYYHLRSEALKGFLKILMIYLSRKIDHIADFEEKNQNNYLLKKFMSLVENNFAVKKMVSSYASELSITPNHLNAKIKRNTGFTASYHIHQRIMLEAKRYAVHSSLTMKEVSFLLGFDDTSHFSKFFKNQSGICFSNFKKHSESVF
ncbi:helix-turn-helix domain-containing protein [Dyadobacter sp. 3J3]|uniref:helix-turn-helix domain-containing protein n=1 Tax=Dyadobacter sp. 3J3 TaxID=2606600 RepID=UPI00135755DF|nr:helix-turn-helix domain-containing protein [Dyadobacter sp. 3J3]